MTGDEGLAADYIKTHAKKGRNNQEASLIISTTRSKVSLTKIV